MVAPLKVENEDDSELFPKGEIIVFRGSDGV